ncbi:tail fiber assembly protein, partial [Escherichia coli]
DRNRSHWSTSKTPSYTKSVSWQHHPDPEAEEKKTRLIQEATDNITILQDAVNFEMATDEEVSMLSSWKKYRVLVSRIDINTAPDIVWPEL